MSDDLNELIGYQLQSTAYWRRNKAEQFPDDPRNLEAAEELERLAEQIEKLENSEIHKRLRDLCDRFTAVDSGDGWYHISEEISAELRSIGFRTGYETGEQFLKWFCELLEEAHRSLIEDKPSDVDDAVPIPGTFRAGGKRSGRESRRASIRRSGCQGAHGGSREKYVTFAGSSGRLLAKFGGRR